MDDEFLVELILGKKDYPKIYNSVYIIIVIVLIFIYVIFTYNYQEYYQTMAVINNKTLELPVTLEYMDMISNGNYIIINNKKYNYYIKEIKKDLYINDSLENYKIFVLSVNNLIDIDNYIYQVKVPLENKKIYKYLKEYI